MYKSKAMKTSRSMEIVCLDIVFYPDIQYDMHQEEIICLQFARKYIFLIAKEKSRTYKRSSTSKEPTSGHYSLLIRVSRRKPTLVARCMVNAIT